VIICRTSELPAARAALREPDEAILDEEALVIYIGDSYQRPISAWHVSKARLYDDCQTLSERASLEGEPGRHPSGAGGPLDSGPGRP
jgi:hypothetical protein